MSVVLFSNNVVPCRNHSLSNKISSFRDSSSNSNDENLESQGPIGHCLLGDNKNKNNNDDENDNNNNSNMINTEDEANCNMSNIKDDINNNNTKIEDDEDEQEQQIFKKLQGEEEDDDEIATASTGAASSASSSSIMVSRKQQQQQQQQPEGGEVENFETAKSNLLEILTKQLEFYFSSLNLSRDSYLCSVMYPYKGGWWCPATTLAQFANVNRIVGLHDPTGEILASTYVYRGINSGNNNDNNHHNRHVGEGGGISCLVAEAAKKSKYLEIIPLFDGSIGVGPKRRKNKRRKNKQQQQQRGRQEVPSRTSSKRNPDRTSEQPNISNKDVEVEEKDDVVESTSSNEQPQKEEEQQQLEEQQKEDQQEQEDHEHQQEQDQEEMVQEEQEHEAMLQEEQQEGEMAQEGHQQEEDHQETDDIAVAESYESEEERTTIILRDVPSQTTEEDIQKIFHSLLVEKVGSDSISSLVKVYPDLGNCWFVQLKGTSWKEDVANILWDLRSKKLHGEQIKARLKSESAVKSYYVHSIVPVMMTAPNTAAQSSPSSSGRHGGRRRRGGSSRKKRRPPYQKRDGKDHKEKQSNQSSLSQEEEEEAEKNNPPRGSDWSKRRGQRGGRHHAKRSSNNNGGQSSPSRRSKNKNQRKPVQNRSKDTATTTTTAPGLDSQISSLSIKDDNSNNEDSPTPSMGTNQQEVQ